MKAEERAIIILSALNNSLKAMDNPDLYNRYERKFVSRQILEAEREAMERVFDVVRKLLESELKPDVPCNPYRVYTNAFQELQELRDEMLK